MTRLNLFVGYGLLATLLLLSNEVRGQVSEIKREAQRDKNESHTYSPRLSGSGSNDGSFFTCDDDLTLGETVALFLLKATFYGVYYVGEQAQVAALSNRDAYPERISLEGHIHTAFDVGSGSMAFQPKLRANWGIFASDMQYSSVNDYSGTLNTFDWQVLILRVPIKNLNLEYGIGFTSLFDPKITYFESSVGANWCMLHQKANLNGAYRWTSSNSRGERFRQEASVSWDYQTWQWGKLRVSPMVGYTYQKYFDVDQMRFVKFGLVGRLF